jgi:hypothetical protein
MQYPAGACRYVSLTLANYTYPQKLFDRFMQSIFLAMLNYTRNFYIQELDGFRAEVKL